VSYLIFCSFEVGGFPFRMAETLNRYGVETFYIFLGRKRSDHDSALFHYGPIFEEWDLSDMFGNGLYNSGEVVAFLRQIKAKRNITHCLATGTNAYLLKKAGINYKYWSYGSDLDERCFSQVGISSFPFWRNFYLAFIDRPKTRKSICQSDSVMIAPYQTEALEGICPKKEMFFLPHYFKVVDYSMLLRQKNENKRMICNTIQAQKFFFSSARHVWSGHLRYTTNNKGNDVVLHSYALYLKLTNDFTSKLVLVKKGPDVESSRLLAQDLGVSNNVVWVNEMRREELDRYYQGATICFGQFGTPVVSYAALEPLANGSISISLSDENHSKVPFYKENPPIFNSKTPEEIAPFMVRMVSEKEKYADLSYKSWLWTKNHCSEEKFVESFLELFVGVRRCGT
jgi:hypothetical protein